MLKSRKSRLAAIISVCAVSMAFAAPAQAQNQQEGLVNVAVEDVVVQLPIAVAANVCDVNVAVLAELADAGGTCRATADSAASAGPSGNGPPTQQEGLVNVLLDDVVVQVPVAVAANVCDVNVAVLAEIIDAPFACRAASDAQAGAGGGGQQASADAFNPIEVDLDIGGDTVLDNLASNDVAGPAPEIGSGTRMPQLRALLG